MKHYSPSNIKNMLMFAFSNFVLLGCMRAGCMRAGCLVNNSVFWTENGHIMFNILQGIVSLNYINGSEKLIFFSLKNSSITLETSDLSFSKYNQVMREKSSTRSRKYLKLLSEGTRLGLQTSEWTISKGDLLRLVTWLGHVARWCLPNSQDSHSKKK